MNRRCSKLGRRRSRRQPSRRRRPPDSRQRSMSPSGCRDPGSSRHSGRRSPGRPAWTKPAGSKSSSTGGLTLTRRRSSNSGTAESFRRLPPPTDRFTGPRAALSGLAGAAHNFVARPERSEDLHSTFHGLPPRRPRTRRSHANHEGVRWPWLRSGKTKENPFLGERLPPPRATRDNKRLAWARRSSLCWTT